MFANHSFNAEVIADNIISLQEVRLAADNDLINQVRCALAALKFHRKKKDPGKRGGKRGKLPVHKASARERGGAEHGEGLPDDVMVMLVEDSQEGSEDEGEEQRKGEFGGVDFEDNLTYHEDSLSILRGTVDTPLGKDLPVWITTDTGSMTQLIQTDYARKMKLKTQPLRKSEWFHISSPGGGQEDITEYVMMDLKVKVKREIQPEQLWQENDSVEEERTVRMKFGLCASLPVPVLWGGEEMRGYDVLDYHQNKVLSLKLDKDTRYMTQSCSWMAALLEINGQTDARLRKALR